MDAVSDRDFALDLTYACVSSSIHLSRLVEGVVLWAASEVGFVRLAADAAGELVRSGVAFRQGHETVGRQVGDGTFAAPWPAKASLARRDLPGAPNPKRVAARARELRREAAGLARWAEKHPQTLPTQ